MLKVTETEARPGLLVVEDHLPAGFQIEAPVLVNGSDWPAFAWLSGGAAPSHVSFREDGVRAAFSLAGDVRKPPAPFTLAYAARAALPGEYLHAGAQAIDRLRPERFARTAPGKARITRRE